MIPPAINPNLRVPARLPADSLNGNVRAAANVKQRLVRSWMAHPVPEANPFSSIVWSPDLGIFVAVAATGTHQVMTSSDGRVWTPQAGAAGGWVAVCWSPELQMFVAVADSGANRVMTSPDGLNWTARVAAEANSYLGVCWARELGLFVAVGYSGVHRVMTSPDGITWTAQTIGASNWSSVCWSPELGLLVAVSEESTYETATSPDGVTWTVQASPASPFGDWRSVCWSPELGLFVAVGATGQAMASHDGLNWVLATVPEANTWYGVVWSAEAGMFVAVAFSPAMSGGHLVMASFDGLVWTAFAAANTNAWQSICWAAELGVFVAVAGSGSGLNWVMTSRQLFPATGAAVAALPAVAKNAAPGTPVSQVPGVGTFSAWAELTTLAVNCLHLSVHISYSVSDYAAVEIGVGAPGSEQPLLQGKGIGASGVPGNFILGGPICLPVGTRIVMRSACGSGTETVIGTANVFY